MVGLATSWANLQLLPREALWRIKEELGLSGPLVSFPDPGGFFLCPSLGSVDVGACFSGGGLWRFGYHLGRSGRCVDPSFLGVVFRSHLLWWFVSLFGCSLQRRAGVGAV